IEECDRLGREAFLSKYGFGPAVKFWLVYRGRSYDSKAIVGAAYGFQHPDFFAREAGQFSGNERTVARKLASLGFTVVRGTSADALAVGMLDMFRPLPGCPVLTKQVGRFQYTDGVRIDEAFHAAFNPPDSSSYTPRGQARDVFVLFNNMVFEAAYRYEGQVDEALHLESIRFKRDLMKEFRLVFPAAEGTFTIAMGQDVNHFVFSHVAVSPESADDDEAEYPEGRASYRQHRRLERNTAVVKQAAQRFSKKHGGRLFCEVCLIDFEAKYGARGRGFIEAHHTKHVSEMQNGDKTKAEDLAMLCSNCHRMIHRRPAVSLEELASAVTACPVPMSVTCDRG
ncbi:MAG: HNH endonuclease, partial [bacterium]